MNSPRCLLVEGCDFRSFPPGGQLAFAKHLMALYGERLALVGVSTDGTPVGRWVEREFDGRRHRFYATRRCAPLARRPLVPRRLSEYLHLPLHRRKILELGVRAALTQAPEDLMVLSRWGLDLCYLFPGVENPLSISRYPWAGWLASTFERWHFEALQRAGLVLAAADGPAIDALVARSRGRLDRARVHQLPSTYDPAVFHPVAPEDARRALGLAEPGPLLVCNGRLNRAKGWELLLEALAELHRTHPGARLAFVGDGEDRPALEARAAELRLVASVTVAGFVAPARVATWLNAADVVVVGSVKEGWSVAMVEALACGKPLVSTDVSGARDMIRDGENGFVVGRRSPAAVAAAVRDALALSGARAASLALARRHHPAELRRRLSALWPPLADGGPVDQGAPARGEPAARRPG